MIIKSEKFKVLRDSVPIRNNPNILQHICDIQIRAYEDKCKNISRSLTSELTNLFGKNDTILSSECKVWVLNFKSLEFNVLSELGNGTSIEICGESCVDIIGGKHQEVIIEFLEEMYKLVQTI